MASWTRTEFVAPIPGGPVPGSAFEIDPFEIGDGGLSAAHDPQESLSSLIEREIIPRLVVAHSAGEPEPSNLPDQASGQRIDPTEIAQLAPLALQVEADLLIAHVERILARGVSIDSVMVDLLAPAARLLGEYWESDRCNFVDVTMGLWRLQEVVHEIGSRTPIDHRHGDGSRRALFAAMPGDQHNFGTLIIDEVFQRGGWSTDRLADGDTSDLMKRAAGDWFDVIGLTVSRDCHIGALASVIVAVRNVSRNSRVCVMVGGRVFNADPGLAAQVGADGTAADAKLALSVAEGLVRSRDYEAAAGY